jgi:hypothetical protein
MTRERITFRARELTRREFAEEFHVAAESLALPRGPVCVTEIACADGARMPGSRLVHGRDELLLPWDGVWFRLRRHKPVVA